MQPLLDREGNNAIQLEMFYSYGTNPPLYPAWQKYLRDHQPPTLIVWGEKDEIFPAAGAEPYKRDLKNLDFHLIDTTVNSDLSSPGFYRGFLFWLTRYIEDGTLPGVQSTHIRCLSEDPVRGKSDIVKQLMRILCIRNKTAHPTQERAVIVFDMVICKNLSEN